MTSSSSYGGGGIGLLVLFAALGYFVYGGLNGAFAMIIAYFLLGIAILCSLVPFVGIGIQYWVSVEIILPWVVSFTGIQPSWLTTVILVVMMICGLFFWAFSTWTVATWLK